MTVLQAAYNELSLTNSRLREERDKLHTTLERVKNERDDLLALVETYRKWARQCPILEKTK